MPEGKEILLGRTLDELTELVTSLGMPRFTGKQIAQWLYDKRVTSIDEMTNLSKANRTLLAERYTVGRTAPVMSQLSKDGTRKYLFAVSTGGLVEAVFIPDKDRATLCISSQVGCKMDCLFCMTGKQGFKGNLSSGEIINQVLSVEESASLTNVVYMGMGEPLDNATNVLKSISVLTSAWGLGWSPKRVTLSTVGVRRGLEHFLSETTWPSGGQPAQSLPRGASGADACRGRATAGGHAADDPRSRLHGAASCLLRVHRLRWGE